jgi:hypothetical protein
MAELSIPESFRPVVERRGEFIIISLNGATHAYHASRLSVKRRR